MPLELPGDVPGVSCPGIYPVTRAAVRQQANKGDPRLVPEYTPDWTDEERGAANDASFEVRKLRELADAMDRGETVTVSWKYGRAFREVTSAPWAPSDEIVISPDDMVRPVLGGT
jgi:hypothetical protein